MTQTKTLSDIDKSSSFDAEIKSSISCSISFVFSNITFNLYFDKLSIFSIIPILKTSNPPVKFNFIIFDFKFNNFTFASFNKFD